jgi:cytochrome c oxidase subunit 2
MTFFTKTFADAPTPWQVSFQDPATSSMEGIIDLHGDILFFMIVIATLVVWLLVRISTAFHYSSQTMPEDFNHHTNLELVWAIIPSVIVILIALPSRTLIYSFDDRIGRPALTVKVIGRQWYWSYEMKEHGRHNLIQPSKLLEI